MKTRSTAGLKAIASKSLFASASFAILAFAAQAHGQATPLIKGGAGTDLSLPASWDGVNVPGTGNIATWDASSLGGTLTLGAASTTWAGIATNNPPTTGGVIIDASNAGDSLTIGASGINVAGTSATGNLAFGNAAAPDPTVIVSAPQTWTQAGGRKITFNGATLDTTAITTAGDLKIILNGTSVGTNSALDMNGNGKTYDLSKALISGTGTFTVRNSDTVVLGGANTFTGVADTRTSGKIVFTVLANQGDASSFGKGTVSLPNLITLGSNSAATLTNTGAGGSTDRAIANQASPSVTVTTLTLANNAPNVPALGGGAVNFNSTAALAVSTKLVLSGTYLDASNTLAQAITTPIIEKSFDDSHWVLTNANTVSGSVDIKKGIIELGNNNALGTAPVNMTNSGAELRLGNGITCGNLINHTSGLSVTLSTAAGSTAIQNGNIALSSPTVSGGGSQANFRMFAGTGAKLTVNGTISGTLGTPAGDGDVRFTGPGVVELTGPNTYAVKTLVNAGTLLVSNTTGSATSTGAVTVANAGTILAGTGTVGGATTVQNSGTVAPGATAGAVGTLNFGGDVTVLGAGNYAVDVTSATTNDKVVLAADKNLSCTGTIAVTFTGYTPVVGDSFDVADVSGTGTITGTPTVTPVTPAPGLAWDTSAFATSGVIKVVVGNTYAIWIGGYDFTAYPGADLTATGDADGDGIDNVVENVLGTAPDAPTTGITQVGATGSSVTFQHPLNANIASNVTYSYEWSTDMNEWKASGVANTGGQVVTIAAGAPVAGVVTVTATVTTGTTPTLFVRIKANQTTP